MEFLYPLALLACPVGMGVMMWLMMRGHKGANAQPTSKEEEIASLRAEVDALREQHHRAQQP